MPGGERGEGEGGRKGDVHTYVRMWSSGVGTYTALSYCTGFSAGQLSITPVWRHGSLGF